MDPAIKQNISDNIDGTIAVFEEVRNSQELTEKIARSSSEIIECYRQGNKILFAGNGGSAADAQHMAGEYVSRYEFDRPGLAAIALTTDTSILTSIGNDYGYDKLFQRQIEALGKPGDIFIAYSTSGSSENIVNGLMAAKAAGLKTIGMTGDRRGSMDQYCDILINIPSVQTPKIQEAHLVIGHLICGLVENTLFRTAND
jgi:D-sedoheptulose 7-phosphate isomerase